MSRRNFIATLCGAATFRPFAGQAQRRVRRFAVLMGMRENRFAQSLVADFQAVLAKLGWSDVSNLRIELRWSGYD